jgi:phenylacetate-CoA ligase
MPDASTWFARCKTAVKAARFDQRSRDRLLWSRDRTLRYQQARLGSLTHQATQRSTFYRHRFGGVIPPDKVDLHVMPPVSKDEWMEAFDTVVTDPRLKREEVEGHLARVRDDVLYLGEYRVFASSGSSGRHGVYVYGRQDWAETLALAMRAFELVGVTPRLPRMRLAYVAAPDGRHLTYRLARSADIGAHRALILSAAASVEEQARALQAHQPDLILGFPSAVAALAHQQHGGRLAIAPSHIIVTGEVLTDEMAEAVREAWGVNPSNSYGLSELGPASFTCPERSCMHLNEDACIVEPVDAKDEPVRRGALSHHILVTNLLNRVQPIIRMRVDDQICLSDEPCPCGRGFAVVTEILGRADDLLDVPARTGGTVQLHPISLRKPLSEARAVRAYQIVQRPKELEIAIVLTAPEEAFPSHLAAQIATVLDGHGVNVPVRIRVVDDIPREPGAGKFKLVKKEGTRAGQSG